MVRRTTWFCRACHKKSFPNEGTALRVMDHIRHLNPNGRTPQRVYECPYHNGWHLTSQDERNTA